MSSTCIPQCDPADKVNKFFFHILLVDLESGGNNGGHGMDA